MRVSLVPIYWQRRLSEGKMRLVREERRVAVSGVPIV